MATNQNNIHINSFTKGMNTDTSLDMIGNEQYVFGQNIRITNNAIIDAIIDSNNKQGVVTPVNAGVKYNTQGMYMGMSILAVASIGNIGVVVVKNSEGYWYVYRVEDKDNRLVFTRIFSSNEKVADDVKTFSILMNKEQENIMKVYIADCKNEIISLDVFGNYTGKTIDDVISNHLYPNKQLKINKKIAGTLKTQQVQYTYRFYKRHGICSKLAPLTNKIQVIDSNRSKQNGNANDTQASIGFQLQIPYKFGDTFDYVQLYRISYYKTNQNANVNLIYDAKIADINGYITINDTGLESLQELSVEEFAGLNELDIVPQCIEQNQNYLFAANTLDKTMLRVDDENKELDPSNFIAYSANSRGQYVLYNDTTYSTSRTFTDIQSIPSDYYLNKYVDMNVGDSESEPCRYIKESNVLGGKGKSITWNFISAHIPIHTGYKANDHTYQDVPELQNEIGQDLNVYKLQYTDRIIEVNTNKTLGQYLSSHNLYYDQYNYNDIITSSMFRSLKRNEVYRYGIVIYDKFGRRTNVLWIADIKTPTEQEYPSTELKGSTLYSRPIGIHFEVDSSLINKGYTYQIVRCEKTQAYTKNLLQCVLARPIRQPMYDNASQSINVISDDKYTIEQSNSTAGSQMSPYYPQQFLTSNYYKYYSGFKDDEYLGNANNFQNNKLFQIFNPQINVQREDLIQQLSSTDISLNTVGYVYGNDLKEDSERVTPPYGVFKGFPITKYEDALLEIANSPDYIQYRYQVNAVLPLFKTQPSIDEYNIAFSGMFHEGTFSVKQDQYSVYKKYKQICGNVFYYYNRDVKTSDNIDITHIKDVLNPTWEEGWSNITLDNAIVDTAVKQYKSFTVNIGEFEYCNWVCSNLYDLKVGKAEDNYKLDKASDQHSVYLAQITTDKGYFSDSHLRYVLGAQGPGPVCFLIELKNHNNQLFNNSIKTGGKLLNGSLLCNIQHTAVQFAGLTASEKQYDTYCGFGNMNNGNSCDVFDGDVYIVPCEFVTMFKAYDFNSQYSLQSSQFVYYVPMETTINTFFDYGLNYRNTQSKNLQLEPGEIVGVAVQDRPVTQYNSIYSDNNISNDLFNTEAIEDAENTYTQRIHYSELKTNGEAIDSWGNFKAVNYIDCDTRYGDLTHLLTAKDVLYFWQTQGFGRLTVNERSLVTDNNSNTIQLGQGGVLQRTDYIDTKHGMRKYDRSAINAEGTIYWIDILNKAVMHSDGQKALDYGNLANVQNIINRAISNDVPTIDYDIQHNELLCKFLKDKMQLVFNIKLNVATSLYTRVYDRMISLNNILYGLNRDAVKHNYINDSEDKHQYLTPTELSFVVNPNSSTTKVFDNQEIVTLYHGEYPGDNDYLQYKNYKFITNLGTSTQQPEGNTDREGNVKYAIPRMGDSQYGDRIRGKWMQVDVVDNNPKYEHSVSHVVTKFRQSFS